MDVLVAALLQEVARRVVREAVLHAREISAVWTQVLSHVLQGLHAEGRAERKHRLCVVGVGVIDHVEALLAQPRHELAVVDAEPGLQRGLRSIAVQHEVVDVAPWA